MRLTSVTETVQLLELPDISVATITSVYFSKWNQPRGLVARVSDY